MQFFIAKNGGKEREMSTTKETIKVIAEGAEGHTVCPIIDEIAQNISDYYEETSEYYFDEDADFLIRSMVAKAYLDGEYEIAASIILIVFELLDLEYAADMLLLIARCVKKDGMTNISIKTQTVLRTEIWTSPYFALICTCACATFSHMHSI